MQSINLNPFLRGALAVDAIGSGAVGVLLAAMPAQLAALFNLPQALLADVGLFFIVYAAVVAFLATRARLPSLIVWIVIVGNALWLVQSVGFLLVGGFAPTKLGTAFVLAQALAVGVFAELQFIGLRRARHAAPATA